MLESKFVEKRIQKILAEMGVASRRKAEEMMIEGRVTVNGKPAVLGMKADPLKDHVKVDGKLLTKPERKLYMAFHKPAGVVTSLYDPEGRPTIKDYLRGVKERLYPVGRLDYETEGLLLLSNDGDFTHQVLHPSKKVPKTYLAKVKGVVEEEGFSKLRKGMRLKDGLTAPAWVKKIRVLDNNSWIEITIHEGKKRQIRRMLEAVGHPVLKLKRTKIDGIELGDLKPGALRHLRPEEIKRISHAA